MGRLLIITGAILIFVGLMVMGKLGPLGRLPGDIAIERENFTVFIPITSMILLSLLLTLILNFLSRR